MSSGKSNNYCIYCRRFTNHGQLGCLGCINRNETTNPSTSNYSLNPSSNVVSKKNQIYGSYQNSSGLPSDNSLNGSLNYLPVSPYQNSSSFPPNNSLNGSHPPKYNPLYGSSNYLLDSPYQNLSNLPPNNSLNGSHPPKNNPFYESSNYLPDSPYQASKPPQKNNTPQPTSDRFKDNRFSQKPRKITCRICEAEVENLKEHEKNYHSGLYVLTI